MYLIYNLTIFSHDCFFVGKYSRSIFRIHTKRIDKNSPDDVIPGAFSVITLHVRNMSQSDRGTYICSYQVRNRCYILHRFSLDNSLQFSQISNYKTWICIYTTCISNNTHGYVNNKHI